MNVTTASPAPTHESVFRADDLEQVAGYRAMSGLSIVGMLFGLAAPLCFAAPLLMILPLVGAVVSVVALRRIAASDGALAGWWAASFGLVLCVAAGVATISHAQVTRFLFARQARELGNQWIELVLAGQLEQAFGLTVDGTRPASPPEPGAPMPAQTPFEVFSSRALVRALVAAGKNAESQFVSTLSNEMRPYRQSIVRLRFDITPRPSSEGVPGNSNSLAAILTLHRSRMAGESRLRWLVLAYEDANAPANPAPTL